MKPLVYFKLQAKNLFKDYKTQTTYVDDRDRQSYFAYTPKYFDIDQIILDFDWPEENLTLMKVQHFFAMILGFRKWTDLLNASDEELELAKLLWDNQHKIGLEDWRSYLANIEAENNTEFDTATKIEIFKKVFAEVDGHSNPFPDYRLMQSKVPILADSGSHPKFTVNRGPQIAALPLDPALRTEFIKVANAAFEKVLERIEPRNPELTRKLWNAEDYVDNELLRKDMFPISKDYALSLIDSFLVHHVIGLATQSDRMAATN